ncbi:MAG: ferritin family protein [Sedimentisphaerales bacterium]|nr:ferritin family protein [Sedimentisphaerales bacterium]
MTEELNAVEVFEVAMQIERDAARFYQEAANTLEHSEVCDLLRRLAAWELRHEQRYDQMKKAVHEQRLNLKPSDSEEYKALAGMSIFTMESKPVREFSSRTTPVEVLQEALKKERDSIRYFEALGNFVMDRFADEQISKIIDEEKQHIETLNEALERLDPSDKQ